jgi:hypothetical protein
MLYELLSYNPIKRRNYPSKKVITTLRLSQIGQYSITNNSELTNSADFTNYSYIAY